EEKVPVPGQTCKPVDYRHLLKLEEKGIETFLPEGGEEELTVRRLLDGIEGREERARRKEKQREPRRVILAAAEPAVDFAILTARKVAREAVCAVCGWGEKARIKREGRGSGQGPPALPRGQVSRLGVAQPVDMGNVESAPLASDVIRHFRPTAALLVG